jgi:hypothetical protein
MQWYFCSSETHSDVLVPRLDVPENMPNLPASLLYAERHRLRTNPREILDNRMSFLDGIGLGLGEGEEDLHGLLRSLGVSTYNAVSFRACFFGADYAQSVSWNRVIQPKSIEILN